MSQTHNYGYNPIRNRYGSMAVALIPARGGSKGIKRKNLAMIAGYPMIAHSIMALKVAGVTDVWVSTEDEGIKETALIYGAKVLDRPMKLAEDEATTEAVIKHFLENVRSDVIIMVQCTSPMLRPVEIRNGLKSFLDDTGIDSMFSAYKTNDKLIWDNQLNPINYDPKARGRRQKRKYNSTVYVETGGFYIFTRRIFNQTGCRIGGKIATSKVAYWKSFQVDDKTDLAMVRKLMEKS